MSRAVSEFVSSQQTTPGTVTTLTLHDDAMQATHVEAVKMVLSVLDIYRAAYPTDGRLAMAMDIAKRNALTFCTQQEVQVARNTIQSALDDASVQAEECEQADVPKYWAAAEVAEAASYLFDSVIDISAIELCVTAARKYAGQS